MNHININFDAIYHSPLSCKIMGILFLKNFGIGLYKGIKDFKKDERPVTQLIDNVISYSLWGCIEAFFWPFAFPITIGYELDKVANYMMGKEIKKD
jgi:hypothetical protein